MPDEPVEFMIDIRCRGCRRLLGIGPADFRIYCEVACATDFPVTSSEARDALIEAIFQDVEITKAALGERFGIARQRVDQILIGRDLAYEVKAEERRKQAEIKAEERRVEREQRRLRAEERRRKAEHKRQEREVKRLAREAKKRAKEEAAADAAADAAAAAAGKVTTS